MRTEISDLSFGYAVIHEMARRTKSDCPTCSIKSVGSHPVDWDSLIMEEMTFGFTVFFHFKGVEHMVYPTAREWSTYGKAYYRAHIPRRSRSNVHKLLRRLADLEPHVYYALPLLSTQVELDRVFMYGNVLDNSLLIPVREVPNADDTDLFITFSTSSDLRIWPLDRPMRGDFLASSRFLQISDQLLDDQSVSLLNKAYFTRQLAAMYSVLYGHGPEDMNLAGLDHEDLVFRIAYVSRIYFGCEPVAFMRAVG